VGFCAGEIRRASDSNDITQTSRQSRGGVRFLRLVPPLSYTQLPSTTMRECHHALLIAVADCFAGLGGMPQRPKGPAANNYLYNPGSAQHDVCHPIVCDTAAATASGQHDHYSQSIKESPATRRGHEPLVLGLCDEPSLASVRAQSLRRLRSSSCMARDRVTTVGLRCPCSNPTARARTPVHQVASDGQCCGSLGQIPAAPSRAVYETSSAAWPSI
jgi:hypothetical protein